MKRKVKQNKLKVKIVFKKVEGVSESEIQRRWDKAFDILFGEVKNSK